MNSKNNIPQYHNNIKQIDVECTMNGWKDEQIFLLIQLEFGYMFQKPYTEMNALDNQSKTQRKKILKNDNS